MQCTYYCKFVEFNTPMLLYVNSGDFVGCLWLVTIIAMKISMLEAFLAILNLYAL